MSEKTKTRVLIIVVGVAVAGGLVFAVPCLNYLLSYFLESDNPARDECLQGAAIALLMSTPFWLVASGAMVPIRSAIPRALYVNINVIGVVCLSLVVLIILQ